MVNRPFVDADLCKGMVAGALAAATGLALWWPVRPATHPAAAPPVAVQAARPLAGGHGAQPPDAPAVRALNLQGASVSAPVRRVAQWVVDTADNGALPFVLLDKRDARVLLFDAGGRLLDQSPVLLGYARGDDSVPGIGQRAIDAVRPSERTTPAGRFVAEPGRNALGEDVLWVDYDAAVSMHRVRLTNQDERRAQRLASPTAADNRISYGCINLPPAFFEQQLWPRLRTRGAVVYVLPEQKTLTQVFPGLAPPRARAAANAA